MEFEEILQGVTDEKIRADLKAKYQEVNHKAGEFGRKLIEKDGEIGVLKVEKQSYSKSFETLKKSGIEAEQIPKLLEKLGYQKTMEEEYELTKVVLAENTKKTSTLEKENQRLKAEKAMSKTFEKVRSELKDEKGQPVKLADNFINYEDLYNVQDFSNDAVLQEKCKQVLSQAFAAQTDVMRQIGFQGVKPHTTPGGEQITAPQVLNLAEIMKTQGPAAVIQAMHAQQASKG